MAGSGDPKLTSEIDGLVKAMNSVGASEASINESRTNKLFNSKKFFWFSNARQRQMHRMKILHLPPKTLFTFVDLIKIEKISVAVDEALLVEAVAEKYDA